MFSTAPGEPIEVGLRVGVACPGEPVVRRPERIDRFECVLAGETLRVEGKDGANPAGNVTPSVNGLATIVYVGKPVHIELAPAEFEAYLKEEGLESVIDERRKLGESLVPGREEYSRRCRSLIRVGEVKPGTFDAPSGLDFEIVALHDQGKDSLGAWAEFRVLLGGRPLAGAQVRAAPCEEGAPSQRVRSNESGVVRFNLNKAGPWLIAGVHMRRLEGDPKAQWQSRWASLTLGVSGPEGQIVPGEHRDLPMPKPITDHSPAVPAPPKP